MQHTAHKNEGYEVSLHVKIELFVDFSCLIFRRRLAYLKESLRQVKERNQL